MSIGQSRWPRRRCCNSLRDPLSISRPQNTNLRWVHNVVTPRRGHLHHGIYVDGCKVVHYAGLARGLHRGALEEVLLPPFTQGRCVWIRSYALPSFDCREVIRRRDPPVTVTRPVPAAAL